MERTIAKVFDQLNEWTNKEGKTFKFIEGEFSDGIRWSYMSTPANAEKVQATLRELIGKPGDYQGEERVDNRHGKKFSMKSYPGKAPAFGSGGGGRAPYQIAWTNTKEGQEFTTRSIQRQVALKAAVECILSMKLDILNAPEVVLEYATAFAKWFDDGTKVSEETKEIENKLNESDLTEAKAIAILKAAKDDATLDAAFKMLPEVLKKNKDVMAAGRRARYLLRRDEIDALMKDCGMELGELDTFAGKCRINLSGMDTTANVEQARELIVALKEEKELRLAFA